MTKYSGAPPDAKTVPQYRRIAEALDGKRARLHLHDGNELTARVDTVASYGLLVDVDGAIRFYSWHAVDSVEVLA
jgi:sRNA-binding regulator protein Hfq